MVVILLLSGSILFFLPNQVQAEEDPELEMVVQVPETASPGQKITIGLYIRNEEGTSVQISKSACAGMYPSLTAVGPYTKPMNITLAPYESRQIDNYLTYSLPDQIKGGNMIGHTVCVFGAGINDPLECGAAATEIK